MMNFGFGLVGMISPWFFGKMIDVTGSWTYPFGALLLLLFLGAVMALRLRPDRRFEAEAQPLPAAAMGDKRPPGPSSLGAFTRK